MAFSLDMFLIPMMLAPGGVSGIAAILEYCFGFKPSIVIFVLNVPLFLISYKRLGRDYLIKSLFGTVSLSFMTELLRGVGNPTENFLIASLSGGVIMGIGIGLIIREGGSSGGTDVIACMMNRKYQYIPIGTLIIAVDFVIIAVSGFVTGNFDLSVYGICTLVISSKIADRIIDGADFAKGVYIISGKSEEIAQVLLEELGRGVTGINSVGMFTKSKFNMLLCIAKQNETVKIKEIALKTDNKAFIILSDVREVYGEGFKEGI